jgi:hypothetical protein
VAWYLVKHRDNFAFFFFEYLFYAHKHLAWAVIPGICLRRNVPVRKLKCIFLFTTGSRTALGPTQPPIQWVRGALSLGIKRPGCEADHSPPSSAEIKNAWSYTSTPQYVFMAWCLVKHKDNFTFLIASCTEHAQEMLLEWRNLWKWSFVSCLPCWKLK